MNRNFKRKISTSLVFIAVLAIGFFASCKDDGDDTKPVPTISLASETASNKVGAEISTIVNITAPAGLKSLVILKNGAALETKTFNNETTTADTFKYTVESLTVGSAINFTFQAIDSKDQRSENKTLVVTVTSKPVKEVPAGNYLGNRTWYADTTYRLSGFVRIGKDERLPDGTFGTPSAGELTIQAGTLIVGKIGTKGTLIIQRGSKIHAVGTADNPIIFTSEAAPGTKLPGDWGGLVICGKATNNQGANIELEGSYGGFHGGGVDNDNSGELKYVRIEYAGVPINPNQEVNSLTMGSVGSGTVIEHIQCSYGLDDSYEWFGGKVNCKWLVAYRGSDDDFDCDFGFSGTVQYAIGIRDIAYADQSGSNGFEVDNDGTGSDAVPFTSPVFSNVSIIGPKKNRELNINTDFQNAAQLRRNNKIKIYNSFFTAYPNGIFIDGDKTVANALATDGLQLRNVVVAGVKDWGGNGFGSAFDAAVEGTVTGLPFGTNTAHPTNPKGVSLLKNTATFDIVAWFNTANFHNARYASWEDAGIPAATFDLGTPSFLLPATSPLATYAATSNPVSGNTAFETVSYIGAFGTTGDWTTGWTNWNPQAKQY